MYYTRQATWKY